MWCKWPLAAGSWHPTSGNRRQATGFWEPAVFKVRVEENYCLQNRVNYNTVKLLVENDSVSKCSLVSWWLLYNSFQMISKRSSASWRIEKEIKIGCSTRRSRMRLLQIIFLSRNFGIQTRWVWNNGTEYQRFEKSYIGDTKVSQRNYWNFETV